MASAGDNSMESVSSDGSPAAVAVLRSEDLFQGRREIVIRHGREDYRLRLTRAGKLILNK